MKRLICIFTLIVSMIFLVSCKQEYVKYDYAVLKETIFSVEIIKISDNNENNLSFDTIVTISEDKLEGFLLDLSDMKITKRSGNPTGLSDECIKLNYINGESEIIGKWRIVKFNSNMEFVSKTLVSMKATSFLEIINKYKEECL